MKSRILTCALLFGASLFFLNSSLSAAEPLKIVVWNVEWYPGRGMNPSPEEEEAHRKVAKEDLKRLDPDILIASEIRNWREFDELVSVVPGLKTHVVSSYLSRDTGELWTQQVAIASKLPCRAAWAEAFRPTIPALTRGFVFAALESPAGNGLLMVYGAHLKSNRSRNDAEAQLNFAQRNESADQMLEHIDIMQRVTFRTQPIAGWIVGGDMNTNHDGQFDDRVIESFEKAGFFNTWRRVDREKRLTWRGNNQFPATTFDYLFLKGLGEHDAQIFPTSAESGDHEALGVLLPLKP